MISVEEAFARIVGEARPLDTEQVPVAKASGRVIAAPIKARRAQPAADLSAMDGYAVNSADLTGETRLSMVGESSAGHPFSGSVGSGQCVRIFTGAAVPAGADQVVIQENVTVDGADISTSQPAEAGANIRLKGIDFGLNQTVLEANTFISPKTIGLAASAGQSHLMVHRAPKVAILATGDELAAPGKKSFSDFDTVDSVRPQLEALVADAGGELVFSGHAGDSLEQISKSVSSNTAADLFVTIGGASVGDKDFVQDAFKQEGMSLDFWKVAMRPGKPMIFGKRDKQYMLGLPGNPASAFVCALIFLRPLIDRLMGRPSPLPIGVPLPAATDFPENGPRQHYMRARLIGEPGSRMVDPAVSQDSSLASVLAQCDGLIIRAPNAKAVSSGDLVSFLPF
ncbi:MAG: molybdopterin molybdotransferase MoeA [Kordiimonadaceae bacterium]|nr:molybdopterin molybdotransferase MoeA [Kordiimonadaceae bacterium]MBO6570320.1 molybdopterin molybdotransferase MoeA [Kordiimonadaceae bacterium]MBO6965582.1 molybdopterin molybdotransferase MoeA [Kordiimonadaceae bacterium]